jgi:hypothetical protein
VSLLIALGRFAPFYGLLFRALPGAALFQGPARLLSVYTLAICALAGIGMQQLLQGRHLHSLGRNLLVAGAGVLLAMIAGTTLIHLPSVFVRPMFQFGVTLCACAACLAFHPSFPLAGRVESRRFKWWGVTLIGIVAADLLVSDGRLNPTTDPSLYRSTTVSAQVIRTSSEGRVFWFAKDEETIKFRHYLSFKTFGPADAAYWVGLRETLLPNAAMVERVPSASNFDSLLSGRYHELVLLLNRLRKSDALKVAAVMDARYVVSPFVMPMPIEYRGADVTIYRNDAALGRAWIAPQARVVSDSLSALADPAFDARRTVVIESADALALPSLEFPDAKSSVTLRDSPNAVTILAASDSGGFLVLADTFYPGWQATLDRVPVKILRANHAFRAIALPPGQHTVVFQYAPLTFRVGAVVSSMTLMVIAGAFAMSSLRRLRL